MCRDQGISKGGNTKARTVMVESAALWLRHRREREDWPALLHADGFGDGVGLDAANRLANREVFGHND
jgi:hypothetical protein